MRIKTRNLTRDEACSIAQAASRITGRDHVAYQLRNGRWKWHRLNWWHGTLIMRHCFPWSVIYQNGRLHSNLRFGSYDTEARHG